LTTGPEAVFSLSIALCQSASGDDLSPSEIDAAKGLGMIVKYLCLHARAFKTEATFFRYLWIRDVESCDLSTIIEGRAGGGT